MTTTETPTAETATETATETAPIQTRISVKTVNGVEIFVNIKTGMFEARFSQGSEAKLFERTNLQALEDLIVQHTRGFTGHVEVGVRPSNVVDDWRLKRLEDSLIDPVTHEPINRVRDVTTYTGVHKVSRTSWSPAVTQLRTQDGTAVYDGKGVWPDAGLDAEWAGLAVEYVKDQRAWHTRFQAIIDRYDTASLVSVIARLREQGARTGRA